MGRAPFTPRVTAFRLPAKNRELKSSGSIGARARFRGRSGKFMIPAGHDLGSAVGPFSEPTEQLRKACKRKARQSHIPGWQTAGFSAKKNANAMLDLVDAAVPGT
jgi:hypothetical protein